MNASNAKDYLPLVQALAEGRAIQHQKTDGTWIDDVEFSFDWPAHRYRVKPEPKEYWLNRYASGWDSRIRYESKDDAAANCCENNSVQVRFREVIE